MLMIHLSSDPRVYLNPHTAHSIYEFVDLVHGVDFDGGRVTSAHCVVWLSAVLLTWECNEEKESPRE